MKTIDEQIEASFKKSYIYRTFLKEDGLKVASVAGIVTLSGTVAEESHKQLAQETLNNIAGVSQVINHLATTTEVAAENADLAIGRKVKMTLLFHRHVSYLNTTISVCDRVVTITGRASSLAEKELTTEYACDIAGVKEVRNEMSLAADALPVPRTAGEKIDDASVSAQVSLALVLRRSTSAISTKVVTCNSVVTLTGVAKNEAEKALVTKLAGDIQGVTGVINQMTLA